MDKLTLVTIILLCVTSNFFANSTKGSKLIVILLDGFKWNYFDKPGLELPGFGKIIRNGVRAERMIPDMPSLSFPNYYSIMTGVHCENHGFVGNYMYDIKHKEKFLLWRNKPTIYNTYWWDGAEPVWITAMKQGKRAYMYRWCGCEVMIQGRNATYCKKYVSVPPISDLGEDIDDAIRELKSNNADLVALYAEMSDHIGHAHGPNSKQIENVILGFDKQMQHLMASLETERLTNDVNVIIVSDHGMTEISPTRVINITMDINMDDVDVLLDKGPTVNIWPKPGKVDKVYQDLKRVQRPHLQVYKKEEIPERWHLKRHYRVPPIFLVAENGWYIVTPKDPEYPTNKGGGPMFGFHGYEHTEDEMGAIFVGFGPDFKVNHGVKPFANVNVYQLMCHLLGIKPAPNNGTWSTVSEMLVDSGASSSCGFHTGSWLLSFFCIVCFFFHEQF